MSKKKKLDNPFMEMSDEEFEYFLGHAGTLQPKWKQISKKEYEKHVKEPSKDANNLEWLRFSLLKDPNYRKEPIYKHDGILFSVFNGKENPIIGYKYYKYVGSQRVFICGQKMADWIYNRKKLLKKKH